MLLSPSDSALANPMETKDREKFLAEHPA